MDYAILIGVLAVLGLSALYGYKRGLVRILLSMVAMLVTFVLAGLLTIPVSAMVEAVTPLDEKISESVTELVAENEVVDIAGIEKLDLPEPIKEVLVEGATAIETGFNEYIVTAIADMLLRAIVFFILIIVIYIVVRIVIKMLDFISRLPVVNTINKSGGLVVGLLQGLLIIWIACLVVTAFADKPWAQEVFAQINANSLLTFIYNNNLITFIVTKFL